VKSQRKSTEVSETETSDAVLLNLLDKAKSSSDPVEIRRLVDQIERVVFHKQMTDA
jgi:hypothetical protein